MSSPKTDRVAHLDFLFPHSHSSLQAESWAKTVKAIDHDKDMCFVNSISYCKRQERKKHEFLVAEILHQRTGLKNQVVVDRSPQPSSDGDRDSAARASSKISSQVAAHDQIRISGCEELRAITHDFQPFIILATRTFTSPPSLLEFAVLVVVVHEHAPVYDVIQHQCYWYSDTVWRALGNDRYGPQTKESKDWINRGKYGAISVGRDSLSGIEQEFVEALNAAQREALSRKEEAEAQKQKLREEGIQIGQELGRKQAAQEAAQHVERATQQAEQATQQAEQATQQAEQATRQMEAAQKRVEELELQLTQMGMQY